MSEPNGGLGRRGEAATLAARAVVVKANVGQGRKTRRNNLRIAGATSGWRDTIASLTWQPAELREAAVGRRKRAKMRADLAFYEVQRLCREDGDASVNPGDYVFKAAE